MSSGLNSVVPRTLGKWDLVFNEINSNKYMFKPNGSKQGVDDLNPLLDELADNSYDLRTLVGAGDWPYNAELLLEGSGSGGNRCPAVVGAGKRVTFLQPKGANIHGIRLTKAVGQTLQDFTLELDDAQQQYHGIYAQDNPALSGSAETGMYKSIIDNIEVIGGANLAGPPSPYWKMCIETSEFYRIGNIDLSHKDTKGYRRNGLSLRQVDGALSFSWHDSLLFGKNRISVDGESVIGLEIANLASDKPINLVKNSGAIWIRNASGATSVGLHIENAQRFALRNIHTEDFATAVHMEGGNTHNVLLGGGMGYSYVDTGGIFFDIDAGQDIRLQNWFIAVPGGGFTLIDCESGSMYAPIELDCTLQGSGTVTYGLNQYVRFAKHRGHDSHYPWFAR